jgi:hypothetical protein
MKTLQKIIPRALTRSFIPAVLVVLSIFSVAFSSNNSPSFVTICHIPPGNPANCHEITISIHALPAHLGHGDSMVCYDEEDYDDYVELAGPEKVITAF